MKLTSKARYGLKICCVLAGRKDQYVSTTEIADITGYTVKYIEKLMRTLKKADIVKAERGASGGYVLSRPADKITLGQIIRPLEDNLAFVKCIERGCSRESDCPSYEVWKKLYGKINEVLDSMTLQEVSQDYKLLKGERNEKDDISGPRSNDGC